MKIFILTTELSTKNGWGRYSLDLVYSLSDKEIEVVVAIGENSTNETKTEVLKILPHVGNHMKTYLGAFWYAWKLKNIAKECDAIHSFVEPYSYIAYWLSKLTGKKYFITAHGTHALQPYYFSPLKRYFHRKSFESAKKIICVSNYTQKLLSKFNPNNLTVINNGINFSRFDKFSRHPFKERKNIILSVGALKHRKGQHVSIEAFSKVAGRFKDLHYYIVGDRGDSDYFYYLSQLVSRLNLEHRVKFLHSIPDEELLNLYRQSKLFIMTSISDKTHFEGFGLVYLEANACGLPVIGSKDSGAEDAIVDGITGFLVLQNDSQSTAEVIEKTLEDDKLWQKLSENGIKWAKEHDWAEVIKKYVKIYGL